MKRFCGTHGESESLYEEDAEIWRARHGWSTPTLHVTPDRADNVGGFPGAYQNGLPASHAQHTCILLLNITERCNFKCPTCYASALSPDAPGENDGPTIDEIENTVNTVIEREGGKLGVLMLSGGEPTVRKDLPEILERVAPLAITRVMINTNGRRIARDAAFLETLKGMRDRIEIYLQYDGLEAEGSLTHRGEDVREEKKLALQKLNDARIFTTLVTTVAKGVNDHEVGAMLELGLSTPYCAGIAFQPMFGSGRSIGFDPMNRSTPTGVVRTLDEQSSVISTSDFIPLPCSHRDCCDITYLLKTKSGEWKSIPALIGRDELAKWIHLVSNTISFDNVSETVTAMLKSGALQKVFSEQLKVGTIDLAKQIANMCNCIPGLNDLLGAMWKGSIDDEAMAKNTFRITVKMFMDEHTFHEARIRQCCVHTGTFEDDPRRYSFCWRWLFDDASDTPAATIRRDSIGIR
jgi:uncharacterized radical SAM superfamily Fe-S cluster-containing enzyme